MAAEINGDLRLSPTDRLRYLWSNLLRNVRVPNRLFTRRRFCGPRLERTRTAASPGRALTEAFVVRRLPALLPPGRIRVLEIGCGSGSLTALLAEAGYSGEYVGVDIGARFRDDAEPAFARKFVQADMQTYAPDGAFDLVISISALEHIFDDAAVIRRVGPLVAPGGMQLHFVPSGWALPTYLWHGFRQYTSTRLAERFDPRATTLESLGGSATLLLHFVFVTVAEFVFRLRLRRMFTRFYGVLLDSCLWLDRALPFGATTYAVHRPCKSSR